MSGSPTIHPELDAAVVAACGVFPDELDLSFSTSGDSVVAEGYVKVGLRADGRWGLRHNRDDAGWCDVDDYPTASAAMELAVSLLASRRFERITRENAK